VVEDDDIRAAFAFDGRTMPTREEIEAIRAEAERAGQMIVEAVKRGERAGTIPCLCGRPRHWHVEGNTIHLMSHEHTDSLN